jgi:hypothetical protein
MPSSSNTTSHGETIPGRNTVNPADVHGSRPDVTLQHHLFLLDVRVEIVGVF